MRYVYREDGPGVVSVDVTSQESGPGGGSGFVMDEAGHIVTNPYMETGVPGVYAAGDIRAQLARQVTTAVGDATTAAIAAEKYIEALAERPEDPQPLLRAAEAAVAGAGYP